ncbi:MAG: hypothetical protein ACOCRN_03830 [Spirochaetia bacterium]
MNGLDGEADVEFTLISDLLRFPIYAKPKVAVGSGHLYGLAGPEFGFVIGDVRSELETVVEVPDADIRESDTETGSEVPDNRFLFGAGVGAGATTSL